MSNGANNWKVSWSAISFFQGVLAKHSSVASFIRANDIQFKIIRKEEMPDVNAVLVDDYRLGEAAVYAILQEFDGVNAVVNNGSWNRIVLDWRAFAKRTGVVVFELADFLGALNVKQLASYATREEREERSRKRRQSS